MKSNVVRNVFKGQLFFGDELRKNFAGACTEQTTCEKQLHNKRNGITRVRFQQATKIRKEAHFESHAPNA